MSRTLVFLAFILPLAAAPPKPTSASVLDDQTLAWNRGDIATFMTGYENSPNTTFVGTSVTKGYAAVL